MDICSAKISNLHIQVCTYILCIGQIDYHYSKVRRVRRDLESAFLLPLSMEKMLSITQNHRRQIRISTVVFRLRQDAGFQIHLKNFPFFISLH